MRAGILEEPHGDAEVSAAIRRDSRLSERHKQVLLEIYESFCKESAGPDGAAGKGDSNV